MPREIDTREAAYQRMAESQVAPATETVRVALENFAMPAGIRGGRPQAQKIDPFTGCPAEVQIPGYQPSGETTDALIQDAVRITQEMTATGFAGDAQPPEFMPDSNVVSMPGEGGTKVVHLHQHYRCVPIFQMTQTVRFGPRAMDIVGSSLPMRGRDIPIDPQISVTDAVQIAVLHLAEDAHRDAGQIDGWGQPTPPVALDVSSFQPKVLATFSMPSCPTVLDQGPFDHPIRANLVFFYQGPDASGAQMLRLGWLFDICLPQAGGQYAVIVGADAATKSELLYVQETSHTMGVADREVRGNVFETDGSQARQMVPFPRPDADYPPTLLPAPAGFPGPWVDSNTDKTIGPNTHAFLVVPPATPGEGTHDDGRLTFNPGDSQGGSQQVLNEFYLCNYMHDFFQKLGFTVDMGNFEGDDPVEAFAHPRPVFGTANMLTPPDGSSPTMNMGLVSSTGRHTALDADVVFHEFVHGVTNRVVGGRDNATALQQAQSRAQGEAWSDYFALSVQNALRPAGQEKLTTGAWVVGDPAGIRSAPYTPSYPDNYGDISSFSGPHRRGEIWCATLMELTRRIVDAIGDRPRGHQIAWQIVFNGLVLSPANPSFLDSRDAILRALDELMQQNRISAGERDSAFRAAWEAFAGFGMGRDAASPFGASVFGIQQDFHLPDVLGGDEIQRPTSFSAAGTEGVTGIRRSIPADLEPVARIWDQLPERARGRILEIVEDNA